jgi:hypothetical protein
MAINAWVRLPSEWIETRGLCQLSWRHGGAGSDNTAALMALTVIAHNADPETGISHVTYDRICDDTGLSRAKHIRTDRIRSNVWMGKVPGQKHVFRRQNHCFR